MKTSYVTSIIVWNFTGTLLSYIWVAPRNIFVIRSQLALRRRKDCSEFGNCLVVTVSTVVHSTLHHHKFSQETTKADELFQFHHPRSTLRNFDLLDGLKNSSPRSEPILPQIRENVEYTATAYRTNSL